jgi:hypothetical protein
MRGRVWLYGPGMRAGVAGTWLHARRGMPEAARHVLAGSTSMVAYPMQQAAALARGGRQQSYGLRLKVGPLPDLIANIYNRADGLCRKKHAAFEGTEGRRRGAWWAWGPACYGAAEGVLSRLSLGNKLCPIQADLSCRNDCTRP